MDSVLVEILVIVLLIIINGVFAMSEIAVVSARPVRLQQRADAGDKGARIALDLANTPNQFLSTVQIGITLIGILAGAFAGATLAEELAAGLSRIRLLAPYSESIGVSVVVVAITYLSLVVGELAPKRIAMNNAERIASTVAPWMRRLSRIASPAVRLLSFSTEMVLRALGIRPSLEKPVTEEEIELMIEQGTQVGVFVPAEQEMVKQVFRLADRSVGTLMIPRPEVIWLDLEDSLEEIRLKITASGYSQFPVAQHDLDNVLGMVYTQDLLAQVLSGAPADLKAALQPALFVPESMLALDVLERLKETRSQVVLVIDEYGGFQGLVTIHDILEAIVGDIPMPYEGAEAEVFQRKDGSWLMDGRLLADELRDVLRLEEMPYEGEGHYRTLGGLVMACLGRIPSIGDSFEWGGLRFEVVDMDGHRVDKVLIAPESPASPHNRD
ncbi:MAG: HlyC/CorC family transporter [Chloroflexia bacterium]|nr:HlyC/CorC family transporter [Chloroflexia bacterium]